MANFIVFNKVEWKPPIRSKLLTAPKLKLDVSFSDHDLKEMVGKQRAAFDKSFKAFDAKFYKLASEKIKAVQAAVDWTEERIVKKATKKAREEVLNTANKLLAQGFKTFESEIRTLARKCYEDAITQSCKAMKLKMTKAKAKCIAKISIIVLLTLTAAGLALVAAGVGVAASVATGGAAVPVIAGAVLAGLGMVATGAGALYSSYKTAATGWANSKNQIKIISKDIDTLNKATGKLEELKALATTGSPGKLAKYQKFGAAITGKMVTLDKHVGQLDKYIFTVSKEIKKQNDEMNKLIVKINKSGDKKLQNQANKLSADLMKSIGSLSKMGNVRIEAQQAQKVWESKQTLSLGKLEGTIQELVKAAPFLIAVGKGVKEVGTQAKAVVKALS